MPGRVPEGIQKVDVHQPVRLAVTALNNGLPPLGACIVEVARRVHVSEPPVGVEPEYQLVALSEIEGEVSAVWTAGRVEHYSLNSPHLKVGVAERYYIVPEPTGSEILRLNEQRARNVAAGVERQRNPVEIVRDADDLPHKKR